jgi:hypothetical protein
VTQWRLVSPPRQCCHSLWFAWAGISGPERHNCSTALTFLPKSGTLRPLSFFFFFQNSSWQ